MTDKVQKILSEITTRKLCTMDEHMAFYNDTAKKDYEFLCEIEEFMKTLQEEPVSEDLEEAIDTYLKSYWGGEKEKQEWPFLKKMAIHFANLQKQQIMVKAKSGTVQKDNQVILDDGAYIDLDPSMQLKPSFVGLKEGDRIKVVVIKEMNEL